MARDQAPCRGEAPRAVIIGIMLIISIVLTITRRAADSCFHLSSAILWPRGRRAQPADDRAHSQWSDAERGHRGPAAGEGVRAPGAALARPPARPHATPARLHQEHRDRAIRADPRACARRYGAGIPGARY